MLLLLLLLLRRLALEKADDASEVMQAGSGTQLHLQDAELRVHFTN